MKNTTYSFAASLSVIANLSVITVILSEAEGSYATKVKDPSTSLRMTGSSRPG